MKTLRHRWDSADEAEQFASILRQYQDGELTEDEFRRFRLTNGSYGERFQPDFAMVRVRIPAGEVNPDQLECLAFVADTLSIGSAHLTTRQDFQLHWVQIGDVPEVLRRLAAAGLTTREACGNVIRNISCCCMAGICPHEVWDVTPYARALTRFFLRNTMNQFLPRKFKINLSGCMEDCALARVADVGIFPLKNDHGGRAFNVYVGGGLGPAARISQLLEEQTPESLLLPTCMATIRLYDRLGDRAKMWRNRMRYIVQDMGFDKFRELVLQERTVVRATLPATVKLDLAEEAQIEAVSDGSPLPDGIGDESYHRWVQANVTPQKQEGYYAIHITPLGGDLAAHQLDAIANICRRYSMESSARTTPMQSILLRWISGKDIAKVYDELKKAGLANPRSRLTISGCTGTTSCNLAITNSHGLVKELQRRAIEANLDRLDGIDGAAVRVSGCPNSCGHHWIATLGFYGGVVRVEGAIAPAYTMMINGRVGQDASLAKIVTRVPVWRVFNVIMRVVELYQEEHQGGESLSQWVDRVAKGKAGSEIRSLADLKKAIEEAAAIPPPDKDPTCYTDIGSERRFTAKTARGECAA